MLWLNLVVVAIVGIQLLKLIFSFLTTGYLLSRISEVEGLVFHLRSGKEDVFRVLREEEHFQNETDISEGKGLKGKLLEFEREAIKRALEENGWKITKTAEGLGIPKRTLYYKMKKYRLGPRY